MRLEDGSDIYYPASDIYYISTNVCHKPDMYDLCNSDGTVQEFGVYSSRLNLVPWEHEASESEDGSEADKSSEEDNTKQDRKRRKYVASLETENPWKM